MGNSAVLGAVSMVLIAVIGWIIVSVRLNSSSLKDHEGRLTKQETNIEWIRNVLTKIADKLNIKEI